MDVYEIFTSGRYHRDMKVLKILASNSKHFKIYDTFSKWQVIDGPPAPLIKGGGVVPSKK